MLTFPLCHYRAELGLEASEESRAYVLFLVPHSLESQLAAFLAKLEAASADLGICDIQMGLTSLEEVFLNIAKKVIRSLLLRCPGEK